MKGLAECRKLHLNASKGGTEETRPIHPQDRFSVLGGVWDESWAENGRMAGNLYMEKLDFPCPLSSANQLAVPLARWEESRGFLS